MQKVRLTYGDRNGTLHAEHLFLHVNLTGDDSASTRYAGDVYYQREAAKSE
jgi:hypothetical protein